MKPTPETDAEFDRLRFGCEPDHESLTQRDMTEYAGDEAALIKEVVQLRKVADELVFQLCITHNETGCKSQCPTTVAINNYNQLPHVIERNKSK